MSGNSSGLNELFSNNRSAATTIVIPVMNESENVMPLVRRLYKACKGHSIEMLYVDDSKDTDTVDAVTFAQKQYGDKNFSVGIYHRTGADVWGGLSGSVTDGIKMAQHDQIIVMDGDLQHPPELIPEIIEEGARYDVVVASRYTEGGEAGGLDGGIRHFVSRFSTYLAKAFFPSRLRSVTDPMTGFFLINREQLDLRLLRPKGFKILLEILATHPELTRVQVPLQFGERNAGESKTSLKQGIAFFSQLANLKVIELVRMFTALPKFFQFGVIGGGVFVVGMAILYTMVEFLGVSPFVANGVQLVVTFALNYLLNRHLTWGERTVSKHAVHKFVISRGATTVLNYYLFVVLFRRVIDVSVAGVEFVYTIDYLVANVITLIVITLLNFVVSDLWAFAESEESGSSNEAQKQYADYVSTDVVKPVPAEAERYLESLDKSETSAQPTFALQKILNVSKKINVFGTLIGVLGLVIVGLIVATSATIAALLALAGVFLFVQSSVEVWRMLYAYRNPDAVDRLRFPAQPTINEKFCLIVPARHESDVLGSTLQKLAQQTHPTVDIITIICDDDTETLHVAYEAAIHHANVTVMQYPLGPNEKPNKPKQLNHVYRHIRDKDYTVVGIVDAEDTVHPELLEYIDASFADKEVGIVQGGVQLMNHDSSWYSLHNVLEYYRWFNSAMSFHARHRFMPLGGNTIFVKNELLQKSNGWPETLTEDCSLGVLLSTRYNAKTVVHYDPRLATQEETPDSLKGLFKQRVRWNQGFFHEWLKGVWRELPTFRQRVLANYVLMSPIILGGISVLMFASLSAAIFLSAPVGLVLLMYLSLIPGVLLVIVNAVFLHDFGKVYERKIRLKHYALILTTSFFYQIVLNIAAFWAVIRHFRGDQSWHKTVHTGLHRQSTAPAGLQSAAALEGARK